MTGFEPATFRATVCSSRAARHSRQRDCGKRRRAFAGSLPRVATDYRPMALALGTDPPRPPGADRRMTPCQKCRVFSALSVYARAFFAFGVSGDRWLRIIVAPAYYCPLFSTRQTRQKERFARFFSAFLLVGLPFSDPTKCRVDPTNRPQECIRLDAYRPIRLIR